MHRSACTAAEALVFADSGCSEGHHSLMPVAVAIAALRERVGPERAISVVHTDLPDNDFTALFQTLATDPNSHLSGDRAAFASAVDRSFYEPRLPARSVTLGWRSWAVQWLDRFLKRCTVRVKAVDLRARVRSAPRRLRRRSSHTGRKSQSRFRRCTAFASRGQPAGSATCPQG
ncbi:MAG TPA: hypothetical protein VGD78_21100 [Chthoniobacterales bacterium]